MFRSFHYLWCQLKAFGFPDCPTCLPQEWSDNERNIKLVSEVVYFLYYCTKLTCQHRWPLSVRYGHACLPVPYTVPLSVRQRTSDQKWSAADQMRLRCHRGILVTDVKADGRHTQGSLGITLSTRPQSDASESFLYHSNDIIFTGLASGLLTPISLAILRKSECTHYPL